MKQYKRKKPKREVIIHPWIAEDSFIYSQTCAKLIYNAGETTVRFNGREERIDGRAVLISKKKQLQHSWLHAAKTLKFTKAMQRSYLITSNLKMQLNCRKIHSCAATGTQMETCAMRR